MEAEKDLVRHTADLSCDVLKIPHHGSKSSSSDDFLSRARPSIAIASAGRGNPFHHPSSEVVERYERSGVRLFRTDRDGAVIVIIDRDGMRIIPWADMILKRITPDEAKGWMDVERENRGRIWKRISEGV
jgi:beta-lactamase superfamily II metal-dependent hydrolase